MKDPVNKPIVGMIGCGAFGRLMLEHLSPYFRFKVHDPALTIGAQLGDDCEISSMAEAARCPIVILATPVSALKSVVAKIASEVRPGALVIDVGSVKSKPAQIMLKGLPGHVDILCTHPLFGPQSAKGGLRNLKIVLCPLRCRTTKIVSSFLKRKLRLRVIQATPEDHDRELAVAQGLTHLIAQVLLKMEPLPDTMTTASFDLIKRAIGMVKDDAPEVLQAIEQENPFAADVRETFFRLAHETRLVLEGR
jgi:prephenate dehydrogenase